jgi:AraC-like DNA-binding protein
MIFPESCGRYYEDPYHRELRPQGLPGYYNIHLLFEGRGTVHHNGKTTELQAGQGFLYAPDQSQDYGSDLHEPWDVHWVHFYGTGVDTLLEGRGRGEPWLFTFGRTERIQYLMAQLILLSSTYESRHETPLSALLYELIIELLRGAERLSAAPGLDYQERIRKTADLVSARCEEEWELERMARDAGYSPSYFCRLFGRVMGLSPASYLQETRLTRAKHLLISGGLLINQVAEHCGYNQSSYFIRRFKEREGMTPDQYRRLYARSDTTT